MLKKNILEKNDGFSLVELLVVISILGILMGLGIQAYNRYTSKAKKDAYDTMAKSASNAAEEYKFDHVGAVKVNFDTLVNENYLSSVVDPSDKNSNCIGTVEIMSEDTTGSKLSSDSYSVSMCCANYNYTYIFPGGNKVEDKGGCRADENVDDLIEKDKNANCKSTTVKKVTYSIYTMDYINKVCDKGSNGKYGDCYDSGTPTGRPNLACRRYTYHQRSCTCVYSKNTNKFCSSSVKTTGDNHIMKIKYQDNANGISACKSNSNSDINSYVDHVCWYGQFSGSNTVMTFHGYRFFKGKSTEYVDFVPNGSWFHDGGYYDDRVPRKADDGNPDYADGCERTCIHFTNKWSSAAK